MEARAQRRARGAHPASARPALDQLGDLLQAPAALPPQRAHHPGGEPAVDGQRLVGGLGARGNPGVLPAGDAQRVQVALRLQDRRLPLRAVRLRDHVVVDPVGRALVQGAGGLAVRAALDPAVVRIRGVPVDPGRLQRAGVHPGPVHVAVEQEHRAVGDDRVQVLLARCAAREVLHGPAAAEDPGLLGVGVGVGGDGVQVGVPPLQVVQPQPEPVASGERRVDVGVLEAGQQQPAGRAHHAGGGSGQARELGLGADGRDPAVPDGHGGREAARGQARPGAGDQQVGGAVSAGLHG